MGMSNRSIGFLNGIAQQCLEDGQRWFGDTSKGTSLVHHTLGMCGEAGEVANIVKKIDRQQFDVNDPVMKVKLAEELADTFTYLMNVVGILGIDLETAYHTVRGKNDRRFLEMRREREARNGSAG